jgi:hypothetical protein
MPKRNFFAIQPEIFLVSPTPIALSTMRRRPPLAFMARMTNLVPFEKYVGCSLKLEIPPPADAVTMAAS